MKTEKLFRETPFGGYKKTDVLDYITKTDDANRAAIQELNDRITELNEQLNAAKQQESALIKELEIKTQFVAEAESLRAQIKEKDAQIEALIKSGDELVRQTENAVQQCNDLTARLEKMQDGYRCEKLNGEVCAAVTEKASAILAQANADANKKMEDAEKQAAEILMRARIEAQATITEAETQTDALAQEVSAQAKEIIDITVKESKEIINAAKEKGGDILANSAQSIGKIKGNLSSMQMVIKNIENELRSAKEALSDRTK